MYSQIQTSKALFLACALTLVAPASSAFAQDSADGLPRGTYKNECSNIRIEGRYLHASCPDKNGNMTESKVRYKDCMNIRNRGGKLQCQKMAM